MRHVHLLCWFVLGCSAVNAYPNETREDSATHCGDGSDNDLDGLVDCLDPSCDGFCPEETPGQCFDGRDNDGDGRLDHHDARCWPHTALEIRRCSTIGGINFTVNPFGDWLLHAASITDAPPAGLPLASDGLPAGAVLIEGALVHEEMDRDLDVGIAVLNQPVEGSLTGLTMKGSIWIPPGVTEVRDDGITDLMLLPDSRLGVDVWADFQSGLNITIGDGWVAMTSPDYVSVSFAELALVEGWYDITLVIDETWAEATVSPRAGTPVTLTVERPAAWAEDEPLRLLWAAGAAPDDDFYFGDAAVVRDPWNPCGRDEPQLVTSGARGGGHVGGGAIDAEAGIACAVTAADFAGRGVAVWRTEGGSEEAADLWTLERIFESLSGAVDRTMAFDPERAEFRAIAWDRSTGEVQLAASPDCGAEWTVTPLGFTAGDMPSYLIEPDADGQWWHELLFVGESQQLLRYRSSSGEPGSFELAPIDPPPPPFPLTLRQPPLSEELPPEFRNGRFHRFMRVATDLVLIAGPYGDGGAVRLFVQTHDAWAQIGNPALPGSGRPATFDRWRVTRAAAILDPDEEPMNPSQDAGLLLIYSGVGDNACQTDYQCAEPGGATELVFRAVPHLAAP